MWRKSPRDRVPAAGSDAPAGPPRPAEWLLRRALPAEDREALIGDLAEEYRDVHLPRDGAARAKRWYWSQTLRSLFSRRDGAHRRAHPQRSSGGPGAVAPRTGDGLMSNFLGDLRYGLRTLLQTPTFTVLTVLTLAMAIGVNTAIFSMVNVLMFRPLPIKDTEEMGFIYFDNPDRGVQRGRMSEGDFLDYRESFRSLTDLAAARRGRSVIMTGHDAPEQLTAFDVTDNTFDVWRLEPTLGRGFRPGEDDLGAPPVAVLSHGLWERRFGSDPGVLGTTIKLDDRETTVIGVLGTEIEFGGLAEADLWLPLYLDAAGADRNVHDLWVMGRLAPGATLERAQQEATALSQTLLEEHPETNSGWLVDIQDVNGALGGDQMWTVFYMLMLTVAFVLAIACSNIATMMLSRASTRRREIAVRAALGAGRGRLLSQMLTESLMLSLAAGALGLLITRLCLDGLVWMVGENSGTNFFSLLTIDRNVLVFTAAVALLAPLLFGFLPALRATRTDLSETLKDNARGSSGAGGLRGRRVLVATQVSLALALMVVAGLLIRYMIELRTYDLGYDIDNVLSLRVDLPETRYPDAEQWRAFFDDVGERTAALPGVQAVGWTEFRPIAEGGAGGPFLIEGKPAPAADDLPFTSTNVISQSAIEVLRMPLVRGRGFEPGDASDGMPVVLVNEDMVRRYWDGEDPLGTRIRFGGLESTEPWRTVVGVVGNQFSGNPEVPAFPLALLPLQQNPRSGLALLVRTGADPEAAAPAVRQTVWEVDADQPIGDVRSLRRIADDNLATFDAFMSLFVFFAGFALMMASTGIYGVLSFSVAQRSQEIGIRMALGAHGKDVVRMISRQALWLVGIGVAIGSLAAIVLGRIIASLTPGVSAGDPLTLALVALALVGAAALAIWVPARRAVRIDPIVALRQE